MKTDRRDENLHTLEQLEQAGNKLSFLNKTKGKMTMWRGTTMTFYRLVDEDYWTPINAKTI